MLHTLIFYMLTQSLTSSVVLLCKTSGSVDSFRTLCVPSFFLQINITFSNWSNTMQQNFYNREGIRLSVRPQYPYPCSTTNCMCPWPHLVISRVIFISEIQLPNMCSVFLLSLPVTRKEVNFKVMLCIGVIRVQVLT